jgi:hypothetical protein
MSGKRGGTGSREAVPGWEYVEVLHGEGDKTHWRCRFCQKEYTSGGGRECASEALSWPGFWGQGPQWDRRGGIFKKVEFAVRLFPRGGG